MILELDVGNSRIKWRQIQRHTSALICEGNVSGFSELRLVPELKHSVNMVRMCSVRSGEVNDRLRQWVDESFGLELQQARVSQRCGGVRNQYADLSRLGIDRWLAMLAAYNRANGTCMVVDAGTAFTIDVVDAGGLHLGGYIIPGLKLMRDSLESNTAIRLATDYSSITQKLGQSTDEAVFNGTLAALLATITQLISSMNSEQSDIRLYFAGGDAELLHKHAAIAGSEIVSSLVFEGLAVACPYIEES